MKTDTFDHKAAAITGAGSGIGRQLALALANRGCALALADINPQGLEQTHTLVQRITDQQISTCVLDVADQAAMQAWAEHSAHAHGQIHLLFNNAGVALGSSIEGSRYTDLHWVMDTNFWGVVHGTKAFLPFIKRSGDGHIVNISSVFGLFAQPSQSAYNASKFAVRGFSESLYQELKLQAVGVGSLCVHPGGIRTRIAQSARMDPSIESLGMAADASKRVERLLRYPAQRAAQDILQAVLTGQPRLLIGWDAKALDVMQRVSPAGYQRLLPKLLHWIQ